MHVKAVEQESAALAVTQADTAPESNPVNPAGSQAAPVM